jgi:adenylate cyclase
LEIKRRRLTVAFWDIAGFSKLFNELIEDQPDVMSFLGEYFTRATQIINDYGGIVDKFIGDSVMACFGYFNESIQSGSHEAILAAIELRNNFDDIKSRYTKDWVDSYGKEINIGLKCGIDSGNVLFGLLETNSRRQITAFGPVVNFASRLQAKSKGGEIFVSEELKNMVKEKFEFHLVRSSEKDKPKSFEHRRMYKFTHLK